MKRQRAFGWPRAFPGLQSLGTELIHASHLRDTLSGVDLPHRSYLQFTGILLSGHQHGSPPFNVAGPLISCLTFGVHSTSPSPAQLCRGCGRQGRAGGVIMAQTVRSVAETQGAIQVLVCSYGAAGESGTPLHRLDLQSQVLKADRVVAVHGALKLQREDPLEIALGTGHKSVAPLRRRDLEAAIELGHIVLAQEAIGLLPVGASCLTQLLRQASLPGSDVPL